LHADRGGTRLQKIKKVGAAITSRNNRPRKKKEKVVEKTIPASKNLDIKEGKGRIVGD